jgi:acetyl-CoA synthetase
MTPTPTWFPSEEVIASSNLGWLMRETGTPDYQSLHRWSIEHRAAYCEHVLRRLSIRFRRPPERILDLSEGIRRARWLVGAELNITESGLAGDPHSTAMVLQRPGESCRVVTRGELERQANQIAHSLQAWGIRAGDSVAIVLPMSGMAVAVYLGVLKLGGVAVGIPESFSAREIELRLKLSDTRLVITQDVLFRGDKILPLYPRFLEFDSPPVVVVREPLAADPTRAESSGRRQIRSQDQDWDEFLIDRAEPLSVIRSIDDPIGYLFSSGTTGEPKVIPWTSHCAIKGAADGHFHHDLRPGDVAAWPTSLGWMMGPWLVFASLLNRAAMAIYEGAPTGPEFARFVQDSGVTMLGLIPSLVATWRAGDCLRDVSWEGIRLFSSTGECSRPADMAWLMEQAGGRPIIEYCGGTEIAGGYITGTILRPCIPGTFNTPALGQDFVILDESGHPARKGELFLIPPVLGFSDRLLHRDHDAIYYADTPPGPRGELLRRHGDEMEDLGNGYWRAHGRVDDTMNLGGIKVSAAEIEQALQGVEGVRELAAIAVEPPDGGPSQLVIHVVLDSSDPDTPIRTELVERESAAEPSEVAGTLQDQFQRLLRERVNPLFRVARVVLLASLPRTASQKVMRRLLRDRCQVERNT